MIEHPDEVRSVGVDRDELEREAVEREGGRADPVAATLGAMAALGFGTVGVVSARDVAGRGERRREKWQESCE